MTKLGFSSKDVTRITAISYRQLQYWCKTALITPSKRTRGGHVRFSFHDLVTIKTIATLHQAGVSTQKIRNCITKLIQLLPDIKYPLSELSIIANGESILVFHQGTAFEVFSGQEWIVDIAKLNQQVQEDNILALDSQQDLFQHLIQDVNCSSKIKQ